MPLITTQLVANGNETVSVAGYRPALGIFEVHTFHLNLATSRVQTTPAALFLLPDAETATIIEITSSGILGAALFGYFHLYRPQYGESFAFSNNDVGRLTWNLLYRLLALANLVELTQDPLLAQYLHARLKLRTTKPPAGRLV